MKLKSSTGFLVLAVIISGKKESKTKLTKNKGENVFIFSEVEDNVKSAVSLHFPKHSTTTSYFSKAVLSVFQ